MSDFSDAAFVHIQHEALALEALKRYRHGHITKPINQRWLAIFLEYPDYKKTHAREWAKQTSTQFPVLFFQNAEDHGWEYQIFSAGELVAEVDVNYDISWNMWVELMEKLHPELDFPYLEFGKDETAQIFAEIRASEPFRIEAEAQFRKASPEAFRLFGFSDEQIRDIRAALDIAWYLDAAQRHEQVKTLASSIEIAPFEWMSYHYLKD